MSDSDRRHDDQLGHDENLTQELIAYFQLAASSIADRDRLEELLDDLCSEDHSLITAKQADARERQIRFVKNLLKDRSRVEAIQDVFEEAMDAAYVLGGDEYADAATRLTELEAEAHEALDEGNLEQLTTLLAKMKQLGEHAKSQTDQA